MSREQQCALAALQQRIDERVLLLARRGVRDREGYIERRLSTLRGLGDKDFLRRVHLERGVRRPLTGRELSLWGEIDRRLGEGQSRTAIRQALIVDRLWRGSRQAFDKLWKQLDAVPMRIRVRRRPRPTPNRRRPPSSSK
jgi:hypothetical protein